MEVILKSASEEFSKGLYQNTAKSKMAAEIQSMLSSSTHLHYMKVATEDEAVHVLTLMPYSEGCFEFRTRGYDHPKLGHSLAVSAIFFSKVLSQRSTQIFFPFLLLPQASRIWKMLYIMKHYRYLL